MEADAAPHGDVRCDALRGLLREVYALFALLHGRLRDLLDADASAETARRVELGRTAAHAHAPTR